MRGVAFEKIGASLAVFDGIERPEPGDNQILVKSVYTAINPVLEHILDSYSSQH